ncbi:aromatic acid exporter family protein [Streptomyces scopuliridis]|uniref:Aromatic acid exporter family protein n=1 Tax=Streptomyces scopuliridis TaxID=452529 RepID=A0ACD4ZWL9_9ACTN|nr:aromatic acid exporter family protein [Streptomyces scopuliridis]WSB38462.1 aromatic acid exporter family protein [Streptomyces scopuliridis]WSC02918.1 aromatic acid exporter family protein [Streptomyces scopuliridis]WSC11207.1 aromatic acid exporter family protein [Streptomyces scopuliridis]
MAELVKGRRPQPVLVQTVRSAAAATIAYVVALRLSSEPAPLTAPLTALLVVQVTLYSTLTTGIRRVNSVVAGVLVASGFSVLVGLTWWSLGLIIVASLIVGRLVRVSEFVPEVAISAMLVLGVTRVASTAWDRVLETLIGAVVGLLFNFLFVPPVWVRTAGESIEDLSRRMRQLLLRIGEGLTEPTPVERAADRLHEARRLDHDISEVDADLRQAEDSVRLNPRVKEGLLHRVVLRTGLDTLEICTVVLRVLARTLTDLAKERTEEPLFPQEVGIALKELLARVADAVVSFAVLVTTEASQSAETAESRLAEDLEAASVSRERLAGLLLEGVQRHPRQWQLHGALLAEIDRILDELDMENRSKRLMEELDRASRETRERYPRLAAVWQWVREALPRPRG